jgi:hypothetical protein
MLSENMMTGKATDAGKFAKYRLVATPSQRPIMSKSDFNRDYFVDIEDFSIFSGDWLWSGNSFGPNAGFENGSFDGWNISKYDGEGCCPSSSVNARIDPTPLTEGAYSVFLSAIGGEQEYCYEDPWKPWNSWCDNYPTRGVVHLTRSVPALEQGNYTMEFDYIFAQCNYASCDVILNGQYYMSLSQCSEASVFMIELNDITSLDIDIALIAEGNGVLGEIRLDNFRLIKVQ